MTAQLTLTEKVRSLGLVPFVTSQNPTFTDWYLLGVGWSLFGQRQGNGPLEDDYFLSRFEACRSSHLFHPQREHDLSRTLGFALGMIHGGVLLPDGSLRSNTTTLVTLTHQDMQRGYHAGREFFFTDADEEDEWHMRETRLVEWLRELAEGYCEYEDALGTVRFALGTILGELSGHLFPWTPEEQHTCDAECVRILGYVSILKPTCLAARQLAGAMVS